MTVQFVKKKYMLYYELFFLNLTIINIFCDLSPVLCSNSIAYFQKCVMENKKIWEKHVKGPIKH